MKQVQNGAGSSTCAESMKQTPGGGKNLISGGINSETPVILVYAFLVYYTEKKVSQRYEQQLIFAPPVGGLPTLVHSITARQQLESKGRESKPEEPKVYTEVTKKISEIHWITKSHDSSKGHAHLHHLFVCRGHCLMFASQMDGNLNLNYSLTDYKFPLLHERNI